ncbi:sulfate transporter [Geomonas silvestris]|uniref:Sulfate transporter n=1 Tax=Geomonas silvestris TaxID=2740184 RepID=A0A6V8MH96_9BACT|nr:STAS domain-containing protein [Geomonas silvestris]GFO59361.1 sulfate transporter [Geomonas silvestris]
MDELTIESWQDPVAPGVLGMKLAGSVTIAQAAGLKDELVAALAKGCDLRVDVSQVSEIDLTGLQLLEAGHRSWMLAGKIFCLEIGGNRAYLDTVEAAGFRRHMGCKHDTNNTCIWVGGED